MGKKLRWIVLVVLLLTQPAGVNAGTDLRVVLHRQEVRIGPVPQSADGQTLLPLRPVCDYLGIAVAWEAKTKTIVGRREGSDLRIDPGTGEVQVNGATLSLSSPPCLIDGITYITLSFVTEALGEVVRWEDGVLHIDPVPALPAGFAVTRVLDSITFEIDHQGVTETVRLIGLEAPAGGGPERGGEEHVTQALAYTRNRLAGERVRLEFDTRMTDAEGRLLAYVYLTDGMLLNAELAALGWAQVTVEPPNVKYAGRLVQAQVAAWEQNLGLWAYAPLPILVPATALAVEASATTEGVTPDQTDPEDEVEPEQETTDWPGELLGSTNSDKFPHPGCYQAKKIAPANRLWFRDRDDALAQGYVPCGSCDP